MARAYNPNGLAAVLVTTAWSPVGWAGVEDKNMNGVQYNRIAILSQGGALTATCPREVPPPRNRPVELDRAVVSYLVF